MRERVVRLMARLNCEFYQAQASSFSATRQAPWPGWGRCLDALGEMAPPSVLDVAAGNLRFARYLQARWPGLPVRYHAVDAAPELLASWEPPTGWRMERERQDVVSALLDGGAARLFAPAAYDLVVCFGFFHHVPTFEARVRLLRCLVAATAADGLCCVSLWRFLDDARLAEKARITTREGLADLGLGPCDLDPGDRLLGWQGRPHTYRYCHGFDDAETDVLVEAVVDVARLEGRYRADGASGKLNEYLLLRPR